MRPLVTKTTTAIAEPNNTYVCQFPCQSNGGDTTAGGCCDGVWTPYIAFTNLKGLPEVRARHRPAVQAAGGRGQGAGGRRQAAGGRRQAAGGRRQAAGGRRQAAGGRRQAAGGRAQAAGGRRQAAGGRRQAAGGRRQGAGGRRQAAGGREQGAGSRAATVGPGLPCPACRMAWFGTAWEQATATMCSIGAP